MWDVVPWLLSSRPKCPGDLRGCPDHTSWQLPTSPSNLDTLPPADRHKLLCALLMAKQVPLYIPAPHLASYKRIASLCELGRLPFRVFDFCSPWKVPLQLTVHLLPHLTSHSSPAALQMTVTAQFGSSTYFSHQMWARSFPLWHLADAWARLTACLLSLSRWMWTLVREDSCLVFQLCPSLSSLIFPLFCMRVTSPVSEKLFSPVESGIPMENNFPSPVEFQSWCSEDPW